MRTPHPVGVAVAAVALATGPTHPESGKYQISAIFASLIRSYVKEPVSPGRPAVPVFSMKRGAAVTDAGRASEHLFCGRSVFVFASTSLFDGLPSTLCVRQWFFSGIENVGIGDRSEKIFWSQREGVAKGDSMPQRRGSSRLISFGEPKSWREIFLISA